MALATSPVGWAIVVFAFASTVVGVYVGYQAYRGYRRHQSRSMQYLSIGLFLLTAVTYGAAFVGSLLFRQGLLPLTLQQPFTLVVRIIQFVGLAFIAYSLYSRA
jgi:hypothetical protein